MKIWLKVFRGDKTLRHKTFFTDDDVSVDEFLRALRKCTSAIDVPTPIMLDAHVKRFNNFGVVRFYPDDFVEEVGFDKMELEIMRK